MRRGAQDLIIDHMCRPLLGPGTLGVPTRNLLGVVAVTDNRAGFFSTPDRGARRLRLGADGVPGGLELGDRLEPLERIADGVVVARHRATVADALDRLGGEPVELG
jgi:hypothetical protein